MNLGIETLLTRTKKTLKTAVALTTLVSSMMLPQQKASAEVVVSMECKNGIGFPTRFWDQNARFLQIYVVADTTTEKKSTQGIEFGIASPTSVQYNGPLKPRPYITDFTFDDAKDFFEGKTMSTTNSADIVHSRRFVANGAAGVEPGKGIVGMFFFDTVQDAPLGTTTFALKNVRAYASDGTLQPVKTIPLSIEVIPSYELLSQAPRILQDVSKGHSYLHLSRSPRKVFLEKSLDLKHWSPLAESKEFHAQYQLWMPFDNVDTSGEDIRFYRVRAE